MKPLVLIVDDDDFVRNALSEILLLDSYRVALARDGADALDALERMPEQPGLILVDLVMPKMDGTTFLRKKAERPAIARIPVLVLTAGKVEVKSPDVVGLLRKPFDLEELVRMLREAS